MIKPPGLRDSQQTHGWWRHLKPCVSLVIFFASFVLINKLADIYSIRHLRGKDGVSTLPGVGADGTYSLFIWIRWQFLYQREDTTWFDHLDLAICYGFSLSILILFVLNVFFPTGRPKPYLGLHGTALFANKKKMIEEVDLLHPPYDGDSVVVGGWKDKRGQLYYLRHRGPEHVMAIAPTRSGKGVGLVVPTLLTWRASCIIHDIKGELWAMTSGWRQKFAHNIVLKFDPAAPDGSCAFNIFTEIRLESDYGAADVQNIVTILVDPHGSGLEGDHWAASAHSLLSGLILFTLCKAREHGEETPSLYDVGYQLANPHRSQDKTLWEEMENFTGGPTPTICSIIQQTGHDLLQSYQRGPEEYASVVSTAKRFLNLYRDPIIQKNTQHSDFSIADLVNQEKPVSLYLVVRPADKDRLRPLTRLLMTQIMRVLTRDPLRFDPADNRPLPMHRHRLLMLMDEFPAFRKLEIFEENLAYVGGYGIKCYIICQDFSQLHKAYGSDESLSSNCHIRIIYAPNRVETATEISKMAGTMTVSVPTIMRHMRANGLTRSLGQAFQNVGRPLLTPDEVMRLRSPTKNAQGLITQPGDMLIFVAGHPPIYGTQILYFQDKELRMRSEVKTAYGDVA